MRRLEREAQDDVLVRSKAAIDGVEPSARVIVYGSRARGDAREESDYDLLVLVDGEATLDREERVRDQLYELELETGAVLTVVMETASRWRSKLYQAMPFVRNVEREGAVL